MSNYISLYRCKSCGNLFYGDKTDELNDICAENSVGELSVCADMMLEINSRYRTVRPHVCSVNDNQVLRCGVGEFVGLSIIMQKK